MLQRIHFISGLPRSGSTLLAALLRQNPRLHAGMSGPLANLFSSLLGETSARSDFSVFIDDAKRKRLLRGLFDNFHADTPAEVVFDTNRAWCARMPALADLFPAAKVIACVRELPWIVDSIERLVQKNLYSPSSIFNYTPDGTVYTRANGVASSDGMVGFAFDALKQACYGAQPAAGALRDPRQPADTGAGSGLRLHRRTALCTRFPARRLRRNRIQPPRRHAWPAHRARPGEGRAAHHPGPPDLFQRFATDAFWNDPQRLPAGLHIV